MTAFCGVVISTALTICQVLFRHYRCENEVQFSTVRETLVCWEKGGHRDGEGMQVYTLQISRVNTHLGELRPVPLLQTPFHGP